MCLLIRKCIQVFVPFASNWNNENESVQCQYCVRSDKLVTDNATNVFCSGKCNDNYRCTLHIENISLWCVVQRGQWGVEGGSIHINHQCVLTSFNLNFRFVKLRSHNIVLIDPITKLVLSLIITQRWHCFGVKRTR